MNAGGVIASVATCRQSGFQRAVLGVAAEDLTCEDAGDVPIVPSLETLSAFFALTNPQSWAIHGRLAEAVPTLDVELLRVLLEVCSETRWFPDLLAPEPDPDIKDPVDSIRRILTTPNDVVGSDMAWVRQQVFRWPCVVAQYASSRPVIYYAALVWDEAKASPDAVARLLGRTRADVLGRIGIPASTTQIALELGVAKATVSEHLGALWEASLVMSRRRGRTVLYERTALGDDLLRTPRPQRLTG